MPTAAAAADAPSRVGFLGPPGTFTEQALMTQPDLVAGELVPMASISDVLAATESGELDVGFVPVENAIEGTVNVTLDTLAFESDLLITREVVISVQLNLLVVPGASLADIRRVVSFPHATAQCRRFLATKLDSVTVVAANSTAEAARVLGEERDPASAAIGTALAASMYGLDVGATGIADHPENQTRFVTVMAPSAGIPAPTGHDKTTLVVFQHDDRPGSLLAILQEFAARAINLTKLESRPTKRGLGQYCFALDCEGHVADELVADCLRDLKSKQADVKFLGSYPAAGDHGEAVRRASDASWRAADTWVTDLRGRVTSR
ncbi:MAG: prephenate dehydratase [Acidimicrobiales bacterium]